MSSRTQTWTIVDALRDPQVFGALPAFNDLRSWSRWMIFLRALYGQPLNRDEVSIFRHHTGRSRYAPPPGGYQTSAAIVGRQSGKTHIAGTIAAYEAISATRVRGRAPLYAVMVAQDHRARSAGPLPLRDRIVRHDPPPPELRAGPDRRHADP